MNHKEKIQTHAEIITKMHDIYIAKNNDYGDSFSKIRAKYPISILIRLNDKLSRLEALLTGTNPMVKNESIDDTLYDLANYCVLELIERIEDAQYLELLKVHAVGNGCDV